MCILFLILIPSCYGFCESELITYNDTNIEYKSEIGNSITSLSYSILGIGGLFTIHNSNIYYIVMNLLILTGLTSSLHHYFYTNNRWAHIADIVSMELVVSFSLIYMITDIYYLNLSIIRKILLFFILNMTICMFIYNEINPEIRTILLKTEMGLIILYHIHVIYYFYINNLPIKHKILKSTSINGIMFGLSISCWYLDNICYERVHNIINFHALWHIFSSMALFNSLNITIIYHSYHNNIKFKWISLCKKLPYLFFVVNLTNEKSNIQNNYTNINLEEIKLIEGNNSHRRIKSYG